ncbi:glycosyltransferase [Kaistella palustris]|uniref:glycosyltransferase n=1 Tax=Kaistella palustris TaxID=493376 RepID=UPI0003FFCF7D|nr:glycosyltransferase [Kaistella palustris]
MIKVSVLMITYGHENYIQEAIEGVVMQKCGFEVELIIANDNSLDKTDEVVVNFLANKTVPDNIIIKYTKHEVNKGMNPNFLWATQQATGKYIALCEGDDYWTDPLKLQKQVDFLEENGDCSLCFHGANYINDNSEILSIHRPLRIPDNFKFGMKDAILGGGGFITTNSMVFHTKYIEKFPRWVNDAPVGDIPLMLVLASKGKIGYIDQVMSVYRVASVGSWSSIMADDRQKVKKHHYAIAKMWSEFDKWSHNRYFFYIIRKKIKNEWHFQKSNLKFLLGNFK